MGVNRERHFVVRRAASGIIVFLALAGCVGPCVRAQAQNPTSAANPFWGSVTARPVTGEVLKLSLVDAVNRGLKNNLGLKEAENQETSLHGEKNEVLQEFLPTITLTGDTGYYTHDLVVFGFSSGFLQQIGSSLYGGKLPAGLSNITRDYLTDGQIHYNQILFSSPVVAGLKAAGAAERAAYFGKMSARGEVVQRVATGYLRAIADESEVENAKALVAQAQVLEDHAHAAHEAGTAANLDELRARVQLAAQQQALIAVENQRAKDLILLKREIGIDPGQTIELTDPAPSSELAGQTPEELRAIAYKSRMDYQNLQNQVVLYKSLHTAYRTQRLPTLSFNSYYGTSTVNGISTHGNFSAVGTLSIPLFREAKLRGDEDASQAQLDAVNAQLADLRNRIDEQIRAALLDVNANKQLVDVSRSNVDLATYALNDETDRVNAGVDDNLPLVTAQATLATAESTLVESLYQYNVSKLRLARAAGVLEQQYRVYLGQ